MTHKLYSDAYIRSVINGTVDLLRVSSDLPVAYAYLMIANLMLSGSDYTMWKVDYYDRRYRVPTDHHADFSEILFTITQDDELEDLEFVRRDGSREQD